MFIIIFRSWELAIYRINFMEFIQGGHMVLITCLAFIINKDIRYNSII